MSEMHVDPGAAGAGMGSDRRPPTETAPALSEDELLATVCHYFCHEGLKPTEVKRVMAERHEVDISREKAHRLVLKAASQGWIRFQPPEHDDLKREMQRRYPWLQGVRVVQTAVSEGVAFEGAQQLIELLQQHYAGRTVHVGFSGGTALRTLARRFAELLSTTDEYLPETIVFHSLVAGFDRDDPTTDPNSFFTYFAGDAAIQVETKFVPLYSPSMIKRDIDHDFAGDGIKVPLERAREIDVVVTSATSWLDRHSILGHYMVDGSEQSRRRVASAGCIGDMLWQPLGRDGPLDLETEFQAMTLMDLEALGGLVERRRHVLLVAGPCAKCRRPKSDIVEAILDQPRRLITHLAIDSRCARAVASRR